MNWRADQRPKRIAGRGAVEVTGPGPDLTVECSETGDSGAPAGAGRLRRGFVGVVGVFLLVTGGLKLVSGLQESRVLGAADPVLPWLTMRQVLFLAAVLELVVAAVLLRHRAARWAPGLILWLVGVFGLYRLGRWSAGFQGHCGCLGHLFERWPGFEVWAERVMVGALVVMAGGCVGCLWAGRSVRVLGASGARASGPGLVGVLVGVMGAGAYPLADAGTLPEDETIRIGARGQAKFSFLDKGQEEKDLRFEIAVEGRRVSTRITGFSRAYSRFGIQATEFHYDGEQSYELIINSPDALVPKMVIDPKTGQPYGDPNTLVRPLNDATMEVSYSPIPLDNMLPAWIAFASLPHLEAWSSGRMEKLFDLDRPNRGPLAVPGVLKRHPHPPRAPELLITFNPRKRTLTNELFRVLEWQAFQGKIWPKRFVFELYQSHFEPKGKLLTIKEFEVEEYFVPAAPVSGKPQFQGRIDVKDRRFTQDPVPLPVVGYFITNSMVPPAETVRGMPVYSAQVEYERSQARTPVPQVWHWIFWPLLAAPALWYLVKSCNPFVRNRKTHHTP